MRTGLLLIGIIFLTNEYGRDSMSWFAFLSLSLWILVAAKQDYNEVMR